MLAYLGITSYLRDTIKSDKDVEDLLDTKLVSVLHHERKNKTLISAIRRSMAPMVFSRVSAKEVPKLTASRSF